jgi:hypothetical protein
VRDLSSVDWEQDEWDADRPLASENNYTVWIPDPEKAKAEMRKEVLRLIRTRKLSEKAKSSDIAEVMRDEVLAELAHRDGPTTRRAGRGGRKQVRTGRRAALGHIRHPVLGEAHQARQ